MLLSDQAVIDYIADHAGARRDDIRRHAAPDASDTTVWRALRRLVDEGKLEVSGKARATGYTLAGPAVIRAYLQTPYNRRKPVSYNREFLDRYVPDKTFYLTRIDHQSLCMGMGSMVYERVIRHLHIQEFPSPWLHSVHHSN